MRAFNHSTALLNIYFAFRIGLGFLLLVMFLFAKSHEVLGTLYPGLFYWTCLSWIITSTISLLFFSAEKLARSVNRLSAFLVLDVIAVLTLIHASGGVESGFGYLLLILVAISSLLHPKQLAYLFATMVGLLTLAQTLYLVKMQNTGVNALFSTAVLGILLFITAYVFQMLTQKIQASTQEAATKRNMRPICNK